MDENGVKTVILSSGAGMNMQAIVDTRFFGGIPNMVVAAVIVDAAGCLAGERAHAAGVPVYVIERDVFPGEKSFSRALADKLDDLDTGLIVVADWKYTIPFEVLRRWERHILCLQPSRLSPDGDAAAYPGGGLPVSRNAKGVMACLLEADGTLGPVLRQKEVTVHPGDPPADVLARIAETGRTILPEAVAMMCSGRLCLRGRQARMLPPM